ncbi:hypothetical protein CPB83DRAFT_905789 [Crepidotus variabilis]|uniref:Uncharacterized protein n=1 Tax=Crepidotus variabilis TaxID=179855 RepID=A0A9P6EIS3_9AGAR|nr:hypothetical protein CPB83DRAFT_905789 [Crepidotus variabilis]
MLEKLPILQLQSITSPKILSSIMKFISGSFFAFSMVGLAAAFPAADTGNAASNIEVSSIPHSDIAVPKFAVPPGAAIVSPNSQFRALNPSVADSVAICPGMNCVGTCYAYALSGLTTSICYTPQSAFFSAYLYISSGVTPPYKAYASTAFTKCGNANLLPINSCGILPADGFDFFLL